MKLILELIEIAWGLAWVCLWTYIAAACVGVGIHDPYVGESIFWLVCAYLSACFAWHVRGEVNKVRLSALARLNA